MPLADDAPLELLADRFLAAGDRFIDVASGLPVRLRRERAGSRAAQLVWNDRCAEFARLRHPMINPLVDYGLADGATTFEAYAESLPLRASGTAASGLLTHAVRFIESHGLPISPELSRVAVRDVIAAVGATAKLSTPTPFGVVLQPRAAMMHLIEAIEDHSPAGMRTLNVAGPPGCGLRTCRMLAARAARVAGYVPVASGMLVHLSALQRLAWDRHVCVLLDEDHPAREQRILATFLSALGTTSTRHHLILRFCRTPERLPRMLPIDPMGVAAMTAMVFVDNNDNNDNNVNNVDNVDNVRHGSDDRVRGPSPQEIFTAARESGGWPGPFLRALHTLTFGDRGASAATVHESSPEYVLERPQARPANAPRRLGRLLTNAPGRAARLAELGRHASAVCLLGRALRVLEGRREPVIAASCAEALGWIERNRGRTARAVECFQRAQKLTAAGAQGVHASIGVGVAWTDERRFVEAEAALRGAVAAATLIDDVEALQAANRALARCLYWQARFEEAGLALGSTFPGTASDATLALNWALVARIQTALGDLREAIAAGAEGVRAADAAGDHRSKLAAARSMALAQMAIGDRDQVCQWAARGLRHAIAAHRPLATLRLRAVLLNGRANGDVHCSRTIARLRAAIERRTVPALVRAEVAAACDGTPGATPRAGVAGMARSTSIEPTILAQLQHFLELSQTGVDDRTALERLCGALSERIRATSVLIVTGSGGSRVLMRTGKAWPGDERCLERLFAAGAASVYSTSSISGARINGLLARETSEPRQAAEAIRYGAEPIAVLCCRWTPGAAVDARRASQVIRAAALAAAAPVRGLLDRAEMLPAPTVCADLLGTAPATTALRDAIVRAAGAPFPVLVIGESGSGKELVARGIHRLSGRRDRRLCTINCAALSDDLLEAELFGHTRGAFTGAIGDRAGLFEEADGGTLFLDEVGELSARAQAKLLRVLQDGEVRRVGENMPRRVDARIVAATNRRLDDEVAAGRFRADLRFRLDVVRLVVPPLRDRPTDIPMLAGHFWSEAAGRVGSTATLPRETLAALTQYDWPGNVRELQNVMASLAVHAPRRGRITPSLLPAHIARSAATGGTTFEVARRDFDRRFIRAALAQAGGQRARAARTLGMSRQGLVKMIKRLEIQE